MQTLEVNVEKNSGTNERNQDAESSILFPHITEKSPKVAFIAFITVCSPAGVVIVVYQRRS